MSDPFANLFVYGTLRRGQKNDLFTFLKKARFLGKARFQGRLFLVANFPGAVDSDSPDACVHGEVFEIPDTEMVWRTLDKYEGCGPPSNLFRRERRNVIMKDGKATSAWICIFNRSIETFPEISSGDFAKAK